MVRSYARSPQPLFQRAGLPPVGLGMLDQADSLEAPFRSAIRVEHRAPCDVVLEAQLTPRAEDRALLVHWEVASDARFRQRERYGLLFSSPSARHVVRVVVPALEPCRPYWARFWAGGSWSATVRLRTDVRAREPALSRA